MGNFDSSFVVLCFSLATIVSAKRIFQGNAGEVPLVFKTPIGRVIYSSVGLLAVVLLIIVLVESFINVKWWFPIFYYLLASIIIIFLPFIRSTPRNKIFAPAVGIIVYSILMVAATIWMVINRDWL